MDAQKKITVVYKDDSKNFRRMLECNYSKIGQKPRREYIINLITCIIAIPIFLLLGLYLDRNTIIIAVLFAIILMFMLVSLICKKAKAARIRKDLNRAFNRDDKEEYLYKIEFSQNFFTFFDKDGNSFAAYYKNCFVCEYLDGFFICFDPANIGLFIPAHCIDRNDATLLRKWFKEACKSDYICIENVAAGECRKNENYPEGYFLPKTKVESSKVITTKKDADLVAKSFMLKAQAFYVCLTLFIALDFSFLSTLFIDLSGGASVFITSLICAAVFIATLAVFLAPMLIVAARFYNETLGFSQEGTELVVYDDRFIYADKFYYFAEIEKIKHYKNVKVIVLCKSRVRPQWVLLPLDAIRNKYTLEILNEKLDALKKRKKD